MNRMKSEQVSFLLWAVDCAGIYNTFKELAHFNAFKKRREREKRENPQKGPSGVMRCS